MKTFSAATKFSVLMSFLYLGACEPMTEAELAAYQQRQTEARIEQQRISAARAESCRGNISCPETQATVAQLCERQIRQRHEYTRTDVYGNVLYSQLIYYTTIRFERGPLYYAGFGDNNRFQIALSVKRNSSSSPNRPQFVEYHASCVLQKGTTDIITVDYEVL